MIFLKSISDFSENLRGANIFNIFRTKSIFLGYNSMGFLIKKKKKKKKNNTQKNFNWKEATQY
jgi:hypothetical protein